MASLKEPISKADSTTGKGVRALVIAPTRELAHQIHNECLKLAQGRRWRIILLSKATANTLSDKAVRDKVGEFVSFLTRDVQILSSALDIIVSTPLRLLDSLKSQNLALDK